MNRKFIGVMSLFLIILFGMYGVGTKIVAKSKIYETESTTTLVVNKNDLEDLSIYFLTPYITKAVQDYYGKPSVIQWWKPKILEIKNLEPGSRYKFLLKIRVETFKGAHNPPYGIDIITLEIDFDKIRIIDYKHIEEKIKKQTVN
ncbi:DUF3888 domain-containing protein [Geobacillus sp. FW23]|nr:DUF3888 domain-containing protein [Geobacillus sp. FW23]